MKGLIQCAKEYSYVEEFWGCHANLSEVTDAKSTACKAKRQVDVAQAHTNYQMSMVAEELIGVTNLDNPVDIVNPVTKEIMASLSLCTFLLNYLKMQDGHPMIAKVYQENLCYPTHVIIPQSEEAERMIGMMNKNLPAFLHHMLLEAAFPKDFVKKLLKNSCEGSLVSDVSSCKWDSKTRTITTVADIEHERELKAFEGAAWFKDEFGFLKKGNKTQPRLSPRISST